MPCSSMVGDNTNVDTTAIVEPLLWSFYLVLFMTRSLYQRDDNDDTQVATEERLCLMLLGAVTGRAWFLLGSWRRRKCQRSTLWRLATSSPHSISDPPGLFMSVILVPLLCLAIGKSVQNPTEQQSWYSYAVWVSLCCFVAWEDSLWRIEQTNNNNKGRNGLVVKNALLVLILGNLILPYSFLHSGALVLVLIWHILYHSMQVFSSTSVSLFYGVFTQGEWMVVTSLVAVVLAHVFTTILNYQQQQQHAAPTMILPNHATVALSGLVSATVTCPIMTMINGWWKTSTAVPTTTTTSPKEPTRNGHPPTPTNKYNGMLRLLLQLPLWVGIPLAGVELLAFKNVPWLSPSPYHYLEPWGTKTDIDTIDLTTSPLGVLLEKMNVPAWCLPQAIHWLIQYLMVTETPTVTCNLLPQIPRYGWLVYWLMVLVLAIPFAPEPLSLDKSSSSGNDNNNNQNTSNNSSNQNTSNSNSDNNPVHGTMSNTHAIVLARKWFHGIAVLLFAPVTLAAPQLLSLSYAIAWAILMLLESARMAFPMIQQFHQRYLDPSKDAAHGLVISHMALILGCALPLWISELVGGVVGGVTTMSAKEQEAQMVLLQLWGILCLGIGDAMGAVVGVILGRTRWSRDNSRTLEGSMAMWLSLFLSCAWVYWLCGNNGNMSAFLGRSMVTVSLVTLLEAHTSQIDNLVLPLAGATLLLLLDSSY